MIYNIIIYNYIVIHAIQTRVQTCTPHATHHRKALAEAVVFRIGASIPALQTCRRRRRYRADVEPPYHAHKA